MQCDEEDAWMQMDICELPPSHCDDGNSNGDGLVVRKKVDMLFNGSYFHRILMNTSSNKGELSAHFAGTEIKKEAAAIGWVGSDAVTKNRTHRKTYLLRHCDIQR